MTREREEMKKIRTAVGILDMVLAALLMVVLLLILKSPFVVENSKIATEMAIDRDNAVKAAVLAGLVGLGAYFVRHGLFHLKRK